MIMKWFTKANKKKVWATTYGKRILARNAYWRMAAASTAATGLFRMSAIAASNSCAAIDELGKVSKTMAMAGCLVDTATAVSIALNKYG